MSILVEDLKCKLGRRWDSTVCCGHIEGECKSEELMKGKKEGQGMRRGLVYAVTIGVLLGTFWAYLRPHGFFGPAVSSSSSELTHFRGTAIGSRNRVRTIIKTHSAFVRNSAA